MRRNTLAIVTTMAITFSVPILGVTSAFGFIPRPNAEGSSGGSWSSSSDGWWVNVRGTRVLATENGGRRWHPIRHVAGTEFLKWAVRTSRNVGVAAYVEKGRVHVIWTRTNGKEWHATTAIGREEVEGSGSLLFWTDAGVDRPGTGTSLYQVKPWPPKVRTIRSQRVAKLSESSFAYLVNIPGGILTPLSDTQAPSIFVRQNDQNRIVSLGAPGCVIAEVSVDWPMITALGRSEVALPGDRSVAWYSLDGGYSWKTVGTC